MWLWDYAQHYIEQVWLYSALRSGDTEINNKNNNWAVFFLTSGKSESQHKSTTFSVVHTSWADVEICGR